MPSPNHPSQDTPNRPPAPGAAARVPVQPGAPDHELRTPAAPDLAAVQAGQWWQAFTGLVPALLMVPLLLLDLRAASVALGAAAALGVVAYHLWRRQGLTALDVLAVAFATVNLVLYVGLHSSLLVDHIDVVFYTLLLAMSALSLRGREPWTSQFTRRTLVPELWPTAAFRAMNVATTRLWVAGFALCDAGALLLPSPWRTWAPVAVLVVTVRVSRRVGRTVLARELPTG